MIQSLMYEIQNDLTDVRQEAEIALWKLIKISPYFDHAYSELANIMKRKGDIDQELYVRKKLEENVPGIAENRFSIGTLFLALSQWDNARQWFDKGLNSPIFSPADRMLKYGVVTKARLLHDIAQLDWLISNHFLNDGYSKVIDSYHNALTTNSENKLIWSLPQNILLEISPFYRRCLILNSLPDPIRTFGSNIDWQEILDITTSQQIKDRIIVVDDFLDSSCLETLWEYCLSSTIWHNDPQKG